MNSRKKIDFYKSFPILMIVNAVFVLAGVILALTVGINLPNDYAGGGVFMFGTLSLIMSLVVVLIYMGIRYGWTKAFATIFNVIINVAVFASLVIIFQVDVADGFIIAGILTAVFTVLNNIFLLNQLEKNADVTALNVADETNKIVKSNINKILLVYATALFLSISMFVIPTISALDLFRTSLLAVAVSFYSAVFLTIPLYWFIAKRMSNLPKKAKPQPTVTTETK